MPIETEISRNADLRHQEVLGHAPRIAPLNRDVIADQVIADTQYLRGAVAAESPPVSLDSVPEIMFTMCRMPDLWRKLMDLTIQIQGPGAVLPLRDRKLAILRTGWLCQAPYEFGEHVRLAKNSGITMDEVERAIEGSDAPGWDDHERAILRAVEELHCGSMISDATWTQLAERLDENQLIELLILIGQFTATAYFQNSLRLRLEAGNPGLSAR